MLDHFDRLDAPDQSQIIADALMTCRGAFVSVAQHAGEVGYWKDRYRAASLALESPQPPLAPRVMLDDVLYDEYRPDLEWQAYFQGQAEQAGRQAYERLLADIEYQRMLVTGKLGGSVLTLTSNWAGFPAVGKGLHASDPMHLDDARYADYLPHIANLIVMDRHKVARLIPLFRLLHSEAGKRLYTSAVTVEGIDYPTTRQALGILRLSHMLRVQ